MLELRGSRPTGAEDRMIPVESREDIADVRIVQIAQIEGVAHSTAPEPEKLSVVNNGIYIMIWNELHE